MCKWKVKEGEGLRQKRRDGAHIKSASARVRKFKGSYACSG